MAKRSLYGLKYQNVKSQVTLLKVLPYKGSNLYIRMIGSDIFMYDLIFREQLYSANLVITPQTGRTTLTQKQINSATALTIAAAMATIDMLNGVELSDEEKKKIEIFESVRPDVERMAES